MTDRDVADLRRLLAAAEARVALLLDLKHTLQKEFDRQYQATQAAEARLAALDAAARAVIGGLYEPSSWLVDPIRQTCRACGFLRDASHGTDCPVGALARLLEVDA